MGTRLSIAAPADYRLARDVCSYGYFRLAPDRWDVPTQTLHTIFDLSEGPARAIIAQAGPGRLTGAFDRGISRIEQREARQKISRMFRLNEAEADLAAFHAVDPRWKDSGRGRIFRSPTLFQDVVRTITSCNVTWPGTVNMNRRLCEVLGRGGAFPREARLARARAGTLRGRCRVGYRDQRLIDLARMFVAGEVDEGWLENPGTPDEAVYKFLLTLPGVGAYAASNIMQLLGRYSRLAVDSELVRHGRSTLGFAGSERQIVRQLHAHYEPFGAHKFRSYWLEMWTEYEAKLGPAHQWE
ncbi:MAG: hypothetical protein DYG94_00945 [Leptolyngbya sp. PLA3]|nr:MAG: hypothetical protein EDM82_00930 [Cyanobacteria bacterium CYA]MCE7967299.1 hypothetical protein [Leptolyngbya sp. PL-A3]